MDTLSQINWIDVFVFIVLTMSFLAGIVRGFLRELIMMLHWVIAGVGVYYLAIPLLKFIVPFVENYLKPVPILADSEKILVFNLIFIIALFIVLLFLSRIILGAFSKPIQHKILGSSNRILGAILGIAKGVFIVGAVWFLLQKTNVESLNVMQKNAFFAPFLTSVSDVIGPIFQNVSAWIFEKGGELFNQLS